MYAEVRSDRKLDGKCKKTVQASSFKGRDGGVTCLIGLWMDHGVGKNISLRCRTEPRRWTVVLRRIGITQRASKFVGKRGKRRLLGLWISGKGRTV